MKGTSAPAVKGSTDERPYEYSDAKIGHTMPLSEWQVVEVDRIEKYVRASGDDNPLYTSDAAAKEKGFDGRVVPLAVTKIIVPMMRHHVMRLHGFSHPLRATAFARWQHQLFAPIKLGDTIRGRTTVADKFEKRGRQYLVFEIEAFNQRNEKVIWFRHTSVWSGSKPEDKTR